ncbi:MAG: hypothetical protein ACI8WT_003153 [Clostridium sp.]|jgi:hypothetical protein
MKTKSLSNPNLFKLIDKITDKTYYGYHQECYATEWQRLSGCGPCATSNIIRYMNHTRNTLELEQSLTTLGGGFVYFTNQTNNKKELLVDFRTYI